jgi:hypothetical protein
VDGDGINNGDDDLENMLSKTSKKWLVSCNAIGERCCLDGPYPGESYAHGDWTDPPI